MPTYIFVSNDGPLAFGVERDLTCVREAKYEAVEYLWEMLRDVSGEFWTRQAVTVSVMDGQRAVLFDLRLELVDVTDRRLRLVAPR